MAVPATLPAVSSNQRPCCLPRHERSSSTQQHSHCSCMPSSPSTGRATALCVQLIKEGGLFRGHVPPALDAEWSFKTPIMAAMHEDTSATRSGVAAQLEKFGLPSWHVSYWERVQVSWGCASRMAHAWLSMISAAAAWADFKFAAHDQPASSVTAVRSTGLQSACACAASMHQEAGCLKGVLLGCRCRRCAGWSATAAHSWLPWPWLLCCATWAATALRCPCDL